MTDPLDPLLPRRVHVDAATGPDQTAWLTCDSSGRVLDPAVLAQGRREAHDPIQLDWDTTSDAAMMMRALVEERGADPAILIPPARFMELATKLLNKRGGQLDPTILHGVLRTVSRKLIQGRFGESCLYLRHAWGGIRADGTADELMAELIRELFPAAPYAWRSYVSLLSRALPMWVALRRLGYRVPSEET